VLLIAVVISVAAVDALNPSTVLPALLYALGRHAIRDVGLFTAGVFGVSTIGGLVLVFGPGRALLSVASNPSAHVVNLLEAGVGGVLLVVAVFLWLTRARVAERLTRDRARAGGSALALGAAIMATELPTAIPYFGALLAIVEGADSSAGRLALVLAYNVVFVAPLGILLVVVTASGARGARIAMRVREQLIRHGPAALPLLLGGLGLALIFAALF
jgi:hypothetical protein